ncbi:outer membrane receptor protein involved in Fe transport [Mucilaginibacter yixingensis]|uniref:Outer membrane receptor protein involved in Fe transport n=1 Tax=Mucilaginibacter yixingensis TaxID=1295612 RepID=A0A2T5J6A1_9SPHI|nr:TonB-dependent receptor [Mucilaginibacter yixingensis]PTQ94001.1 outer membrane receptor protein involved in Fe transport [Mucilaginibacter yixingensis]
MLKRILSLILLVVLTKLAIAQKSYTVTGLVKDTTGLTVPGATVTLLTGKDSVSLSTGMNGTFTIKNIPASQFALHISAIGYNNFKQNYAPADAGTLINLPAIVLKTSSTVLKTVTVTGVNPVKLKEDTIEFNANAYKVQEGAPVEDVIKKLPGVDVDKDGNVTAQGKSVTKVRVNGKDFFNGDVKTATQNLPANIVQNIQIIDDYGDQANLTGLKTGEPEKVLNITIKADKNYGYFGQANVGGGADAQDAVVSKDADSRHLVSGTLFKFNGDQQVAGLVNFNNTNTSLFSFGGGGPRSGGPGGRGGGGPGGPGTSANSNGITDTRSAGLNYRDQWGKYTTVYGSYSFSDNTVNTISSTIQNNTSLTSPSINNTNNNQTDDKLNHRFNLNIEYKPNDLNYVKISPTFSYAGVNTSLTQGSLLTRNNATISNYNLTSTLNSTSPNYGTNVLYLHKFGTSGRNFSVNVSAGSTSLTQTQNPVYDYIAGTRSAPANQLISTNVRLDSIGTQFSYMEPLSKRSFMELNYAYHYGRTTSDKETDTLATGNVRNRYDLLSNDYAFNFITNRVGLNYRFIEQKYNYTLGIGLQPTMLDGYSAKAGVDTRVTTLNFAPTARFVYNMSRSQSFNFNYSGASNQPTYSELQPVTDFSNSLYPVQGNASLKPEFNNNVSIRYNQFDFQSGNVFFANLGFTQTSNKIVANSITYPTTYTPDKNLAGTILTRYQNADGFYTASGNYVYAKPWQERRYTLMFNGNISYSNNISYISNVAPTTYEMTTEKNLAKSLNLTQGIRFRTDITNVIDAEINGSYGITRTNNSLTQNNLNNNFRTLTLGANGKNYFGTWTLSYDYSKALYYGYAGATNPNILNAYVEKKFLKQNVGALRLSAFDLFNQNTGFSTTQSGSYITQTQSNRLGRYFLLSFTLRLQKFAGQRPSPPDGGPGGFRGPGRGGPDFGGGPGGPGE